VLMLLIFRAVRFLALSPPRAAHHREPDLRRQPRAPSSRRLCPRLQSRPSAPHLTEDHPRPPLHCHRTTRAEPCITSPVGVVASNSHRPASSSNLLYC
ncbi:hypothetical protein Dimus_011087, partial [Dionaea muscipula]